MGLIYKATSKTSGKSYIGLTKKSLEERRMEHYYQSRKKNKKIHYHFHLAIQKYGFDDFTFEELFHSDDKSELCRMEVYYIGKFDTFDNGYNRTLGGEGMNGAIRKPPITEEQAKQIVNLLLENRLSLPEISRKFNVTTAVISNINRGLTWKHLYNEPPMIKRKSVSGDRNHNSKTKLSEQDVLVVKGLLDKGLTRRQIAKKYSVSYSTIERIDKAVIQ